MMPQRHQQSGVSLIEALVALAVMAVGLLGVVGMQATLRNNADLSRQRSEAVRMAQAEVERLRNFMLLNGAGSGVLDFADITTSSAINVTPSGTGAATSATFRRTVTVTSPGAGDPQMKYLKVAVQWWDRRADASDLTDANVQGIELQTSIARATPELAAGLGINTSRSALQRPNGGRNIAIPATASGSGSTSTFTPPGASGVTWTFNNDTAMISLIGTKTANAILISGYLQFATDTTQPTGTQSEAPPSNADATDGLPIVPASGGFDSAGLTLSTSGGGMAVETISPGLDPNDFQGGCAVSAPFTSGGNTYQAFYCAVPTKGTAPGGPYVQAWTGKIHVKPRPSVVETGSPASADNSSSHYRVCRYTPDSSTNTPTGGNAAHPLIYSALTGPLTNQNYLLIRAGSGSGSAFTCPTDNSSTPLIDGDTRYQAQP